MDEQPADTHVEAFTKRALDVLTLLAEELPNQEVADSLGMEVGTVKWSNTQIYDKLRVKNRQQAVTRGRTLGLLESQPEDPSQRRQQYSGWIRCP